MGYLINPFVFGGGGGGALPTGMSHHFDFSDNANLTLSGNDITAATDLVTESTINGAAGQYPVNTGTINSVQAATFDGTDDHLKADILDSHYAGTDAAWTMVVVCKAAAVGGQMVPFSGSSSTSGGPYFSFEYHNSPQEYGVAKRGNTGGGKEFQTGDTGDTSPHVFVVASGGTDADVWLDGTEIHTAGDIDMGVMSFANRITVGALALTGSVFHKFNGQIGECILYPSKLSDADIADVFSFLNAKWGF